MISVSTPWAYSLSKDTNFENYLTSEIEYEDQRELLRDSLWLRNISSSSPPPLRNDLQKVVAPITPSVERSLNLLRSLPHSLAVAMSGSGPSCFALFEDLHSAQLALDHNRSKFNDAGLQAWCCSFIGNGVTLCCE